MTEDHIKTVGYFHLMNQKVKLWKIKETDPRIISFSLNN